MSATPGPWWVSGRGILAGDTNDPEIVAWFDIDDPMAVCSRAGTGIEEAEANARLIAAAPALRDALRDVLNLYRAAMLTMGQNADGFEESREVVAARAVLAQAEGEK
jgi:hypothetical protein